MGNGLARMGKAYCQPQREMPASLLSVEHPTQHGHLVRTKRTNPARHHDISAEQQQQEKGAPALADRWRRAGCACCCAQIAACVGACEGVRGSRARCILVTQEMSARDSMHTSVIVSRAYLLRSWWMGKRCDAVRRQLPFLLPWRLQCNNQAYAASQPSGGGRGGVQGFWESGRATVVMASGMHGGAVRCRRRCIEV
jgi:hypothetical protein